MTVRHRYLPIADRIAAATERSDSGCLTWTGATDAAGYGVVKVNGRQVGAHRASYEAAVGPIPDGLTLDHLCRNPPCVEPSHLEPVTQRENTLRGTGPTARQARQDACLRGHPLTVENVYTGGSPAGRRCRQCRADQDRIRNGRWHLVSDPAVYR